MKDKEKLNLIIQSVILLILTFFFFEFLLYKYRSDKNSERQDNLFHLTSNYAQRIQNNIYSGISALDTLETILKLQNYKTGDFNIWGKTVLKTNKNISVVQLAKDGIVKNIVPLKGNEEAMGHDLLQDKRRNKGALKAIESQEITFIGPIKLIQNNKLAVIARKPVFINENNSEIFWGFVIVLIHLEKIYIPEFDNYDQNNFDFLLLGNDPDENLEKDKLIIKTSNEDIETWDASYNIIVPNGTWQLKMKLKSKDKTNYLLFSIILFILSFIISLIYYLQRLDNLLKSKKIAIKNKELLKLHEELTASNNQLNSANEELTAFNEELFAMNEEINSANMLIESEREQFLSILNSIPEIIYVSDFETNEILFTNKKLKELLGRDITGEICYKAIQDKNEICEYCSNKYIRNSNEEYSWEFKNPVLNKFFHITDKKIQWTDQKEARFEIAVDITDLKQAEFNIRKSEEKYRLLAENVSDVIWIMNITKRKFTYISPSVFSLRGFTPEEAIAESIEQSLTPESAKNVMESISIIVPRFIKNPEKVSKETFIHDLQQYCKDGSIIWIETATRYRYNSNNEIEVVGTSRDITERKQHKEYLATRLRYEENLADLANTLIKNKPNTINTALKYLVNAADCSRVYIFENTIIDNKTGLRQTNEACSEGIEQQINNQELQNLIYDEDGFKRWKELLSKNKIISGNISDFPEEEKKILSSQGIKSILVIPIWVHSKWYGFIGFDAINERTWTDEDVNLLKTVSEILGLYFENQSNKFTITSQNMELKKANATKDKFFSIIAHDLKNPFNSIIGFTNMLLDELNTLKKDEIINLIATINDSSKQAFKLLENLLQWARSQTGHIKFDPLQININSLIRESINSSKAFADSKDIKINIEVEDNLNITADNNMLHTVLRNLINNSIKFTKENGNITVKAHQNENNIQFEIIDTGIGMSKKTADRLFKIEEKISKPGTNNETGTGLGLLICKEFIEKHGGSIYVESEEGKGSKFIFTIPTEQSVR